MNSHPDVVYWRMPTRGVVLSSVLGPPALVSMAEGRDNNGTVAHSVALRRHIPYGATDWSVLECGPWRPVEEFPREWLS